MACSLINDTADQLWATSSGRRILHSIARLDCSNALSNRGAPMLSASTYTILKASSYDRDSDNIDVLVDGECMRLHGILGAAAVVSFDWTTGTQPPPESVYNDATEVLRQLKSWYEDVPEPLRWKEGFDATDQRITLEWLSDKSRLFQMLWLHYFAITVHVYHILDPVRSGLWNESVAMAKHCLVLVKNLDLQDGLDNRLYRGDMSPLFVLAVIGVLIEDPEDQLWIHEYLLRQGRDTLWCGYERAACLQAWWRSKGAGKQLIMSQPDRAGTLWGWKPDMGMRVKILYEDLETGKLEFDSHYFPDFRPPRLPT
ncbi:hypothetical protein BX600DRAFT_457043 [Xylariales sp. PMI_506]|nr:hypothetical protein BX600DRAFT_457043 [Xylariales sp. PMI_506]